MGGIVWVNDPVGAGKPKERLVTPDEYCDIFRQWAKLAMEKGIISKEAANQIRFAIGKSSYLNRRIYGGEEHRTEPCPEHKGNWSGLPLHGEVGCGCDLTGWLRVGFCTACRTHNDSPIKFCSNCGKQVRGDSNS